MKALSYLVGEYVRLPFKILLTKGSIVATKYPLAYDKNASYDPFYPVITDETKARCKLYCKELEHYHGVFLCGRLAEFKYYNMDDVIIRALEVVDDRKGLLRNR